MSQRGEEGHAQVPRHEGGDEDDEREERDERLAGQGDTAVDELRLEHPVPYFPQQRLLSPAADGLDPRSEEHTSELQSRRDLVCRLLLEKKKNNSRGL